MMAAGPSTATPVAPAPPAPATPAPATPAPATPVSKSAQPISTDTTSNGGPERTHDLLIGNHWHHY